MFRKPIYISLATIAIAVFMAGCSPYRAGRVDPSMGLSMGNATSAESVAMLYGETDRWWEGFNDPALNSLMQQAFSRNLQLRQAYERLIQARAAAREAGADRLPALGFGAAGGEMQMASPTGGAPIETDTYSMSLELQYELDVWGRASSSAKAAALRSMAAEQALRAGYMGVSAEIAELYYTAVEMREQLRLTGLTIGSMDRIRQSVELRYSKGIVTALDVYQARQNLAVASTGRPAFEAGIAEVEAGLAVAIGNSPSETFISTAESLPIPPEFPETIPSDLLKRRPDVMGALRTLEAQDHMVAAAVAARFPSFSLRASYGGASDELSDVLKSPNILWNALLNIAMPIFDGGRLKAVAERRKAAMRESLAAYHLSVLNALKDVNVALIRNKKTGQQIQLQQQAVTAGENTLRVAEAQYMQGIVDYLNVLSAQQQLYEAKRNLLTSRRQLISDRIQLARALGGNWMAEEAAKVRDPEKEKAKEKAGNDGQE